MTREDAIKKLQYIRHYYPSKDIENLEADSALYMAIKALEQQPGEDCVSRQAIDQNIYDYAESNRLSYANMKNAILDVPPVTPTRKKGKWIFAYGTKGKDNVEKCSCCDSHWREAIIYRRDTHEYLRTRLLYCPNCGAEMESE